MARKTRARIRTRVTAKSGGGKPIRMEGGDAGLMSQSIIITVENRKKKKDEESKKA